MQRKRFEVRWHGRGGQGAVTAAMILAEAAYYDGYKGVTAAPFFGAERRGAPVIATTRFGWEPIKTFSSVDHPDIVVVLDETLLDVVDVTAGAREDGLVIVNSSATPDSIKLKKTMNVAVTNASGWAREAGLIVSGNVLFNTTILGGFARATGLVRFECIEEALRHGFSGDAADKNVRGAKLAYDGTTILRACSFGTRN